MSPPGGKSWFLILGSLFQLKHLPATYCYPHMANPIEKPTLVGTLNKLKEEGFTHDFNIHNNQLKSGDITLSPKEFEIVKVYRFEGASDPADNSVLYAIKSLHHDVKGTLINGYGMYADDNADDLLRELDTPVPE